MSGRATDAAAVAAVAAVSLLLSLPFLTGVVPLDEGALVHTADRLATGEVLYRDVATGIMPGSYYLHALLFLAFGRSLLIGRLLMILLFSGAAAGVYGLARMVSGRTAAMAAALSFAGLSAGFWRYPNYSPEAVVLILGALGASLAWMRVRRRRWLIVAGLCLGLALLFKQNYGAFASLAVAAGMLADEGPWPARLRAVALVAVVAATPLLLLVTLFAGLGALEPFLRQTVLLPFQLPTTLFARSFPPLLGEPDEAMRRQLIQYVPFQDLGRLWNRWLHANVPLVMVGVRLLFYGPLLLLGAGGVALARRWRRGGRAQGTLLLAASALLLLGVFPRVDAHHLVLVLPPVFLVGAWLAGEDRIRSRVALGGAAALVLVSLLSQAAAVGKVPGRGEAGMEFVSLPRARVWLLPAQAATVRRVVAEVEAHVPAGAPLFVGPAMPLFSFLTDRPNPTRFPLILPGALDEAEVVQSLREGDVRYALLSDYAFEQFSFAQVAPRIWEHLHQGFGPAPGAGWDRGGGEPFLRLRGAPAAEGLELPALVLRGPGPTSDPPGPDAAVADLMRPAATEPPPYRIASRVPFADVQPGRVDWTLAYLQPVLAMRAPWGWRKLLTAWEVPAAPGAWMEFACAVAPIRWGEIERERQGAIAEIWIAPAAGGTPVRAWARWLDPAGREEDRRWVRGRIDLGSFATGERALVILVSGPSPAFVGSERIVWTGLRVRAESVGGPTSVAPVPLALAHRVRSFAATDLPIFQESAALHAQDPRAHAALADVAASVGRPDLALPARRRAAELDPDSSIYLLRLSGALEEAGLDDEAVAAMQAAVQADDAGPNPRAALAALLLRLERMGDARQAIDAALRLDANHSWGLSLLAALERASGDHEAALQAATRAVEADPSGVRPHLERFEALAVLGRDAEAGEALAQLGLLELDAATRAVVARRHLRRGAADEAVIQARRATAEDGRSFPAWAVLGDALSVAGDGPGAIEAWTQARQLRPGSFHAGVGLAGALERAGRASEALLLLREAESAAGDRPAQHRQLALAYAKIGSPGEAADSWKRVLQLAPDGPLAEEARRRLGRAAAPPVPRP